MVLFILISIYNLKITRAVKTFPNVRVRINLKQTRLKSYCYLILFDEALLRDYTAGLYLFSVTYFCIIITI